MSKKIDRRKFFTDTALTAAGITLGSSIAGCTSKQEEPVSRYNLMQEMMKYRKIDANGHLYSSANQTPEWHLNMADKLGIDILSISIPRILGYTHRNGAESPERVREVNDIVYNAMKKYPARFIGVFTLNPLFQKESLEEIKLRADQGFHGFKGYLWAKINDPLYYPVIEKLIDHKMICFMHGQCEFGVGGYRMKYYDKGESPDVTIPEDMVDAAKRYPEAVFQWSHIDCGDFEYICKSFKNYPNIYIDLSGSNNDGENVDYCIEQLGEDRIFFGSDNSYIQGVGKVLSSDATEAQKRKIFFDNYFHIIKKGGRNLI